MFPLSQSLCESRGLWTAHAVKNCEDNNKNSGHKPQQPSADRLQCIMLLMYFRHLNTSDSGVQRNRKIENPAYTASIALWNRGVNMKVFVQQPIRAENISRIVTNQNSKEGYQKTCNGARFLEAHASLGLVLSVTESVCLSEWVSECHTFVRVLKFFTIKSFWWKIVMDIDRLLQIVKDCNR